MGSSWDWVGFGTPEAVMQYPNKILVLNSHVSSLPQMNVG
jgi:hypothetical protein